MLRVSLLLSAMPMRRDGFNEIIAMLLMWLEMILPWLRRLMAELNALAYFRRSSRLLARAAREEAARAEGVGPMEWRRAGPMGGGRPG